MSAEGNSVVCGPFTAGCDSYSDSVLVSNNGYRWGENIVSRGGLPRTRPGFNCLPTRATGTPRGITVFTPKNGIPNIVVAIGSQILRSQYPFKLGFKQIEELSFDSTGPIVFKAAIQSFDEADDGTLTVIDPLPVLMISDGQTRTAYWDGLTARHLNPVKLPSGPSETPPMMWMEWSGNRLWGSQGSRVRASNLGNPLKFTEEDVLAEGGSLTFPSEVTGLGQTPSLQSLLVFTTDTTSKVASSILTRELWGLTQGFQSVVYPQIGCVAGKSIITQYGMTWWYAQPGLTNLDQAIQTYRTSRTHSQDQAMAWSKGNLSPVTSGICCGTFENYLMCAVPSGDIWNAHTWVMDEASFQDQLVSDVYAPAKPPAWNGIWRGIRPVEFVTASIRGQSRCFALSYDYLTEDGETPTSNVWELFTPTRIDNGQNVDEEFVQKPIKCSIETKALAYSPDYKDFRYIEIDCEDISGVVDVIISYAPLRGGYKVVQTKRIVSSQWNVVNGTTTIAVDTFEWSNYRPQSRILRSETDPGVNDSVDADYEGVESTFQRQTDQGFSVKVEWAGEMAIRMVRLVTSPTNQNREGQEEVSETTERHVQMSGFQAVEEASPTVLMDGMDSTSRFVSPNTRRWVEPSYSSMT